MVDKTGLKQYGETLQNVLKEYVAKGLTGKSRETVEKETKAMYEAGLSQGRGEIDTFFDARKQEARDMLEAELNGVYEGFMKGLYPSPAGEAAKPAEKPEEKSGKPKKVGFWDDFFGGLTAGKYKPKK